MHASDYAIVVIYLIVVLALGRRAKGATQTQEAFFLAGRKLGILRQSFFNFGQSTDANTAVGTVSFVYEEGASGAWLQLQLMFLNPYYWFMTVWFRRARLLTTADLFEDRLQSPRLARFYAAFQIGVGIIGIAFANFVSYKVSSVLMQGGPTVSPWAFYTGFVAIVGFYVAMGGLEATVMNQMFQGVLVLIFSVILLPFGCRALGSGGLSRLLPQYMFDMFAGGGGGGGEFTGWAVLSILVVSVIQTNGNIANMGLAGSARNEFAARLGGVTGTYAKRLMIALWVFVGLIAAGLCRGADRLGDPDLAWGALSRRLLPAGFLGFMFIGLLAANMASVATRVMSISALFVRNLYRPSVHAKDEKREVMIGQLAGAVALAVSVAAALAMSETIEVTKFILTINLPFGAAVLLMFFWRRLTRTAVWWGVLTTAVLIVIMPFGARMAGSSQFSAEGWVLARAGLPLSDYGPGGHLAAQFLFDAIFPFAVMIGVSFVTSPPPEQSVAAFFGKMKTPVGETRELEEAALVETLGNPARFDQTKLFPGSSWEFTKWDRTDALGFAACCAASASIVLMIWLVLNWLR
jgi:solute:Na+ symporter, SSS family